MRKHQLLAVIVGIITVLITVFAWYVQINERRMTEYTFKDNLVESQYRIEKLRDEINQLLKQQIAEVPKSIELASIEQKFKKIEGKIKDVEQQTLGLRQAINPSKPEEILTIARLTDDVKAPQP